MKNNKISQLSLILPKTLPKISHNILKLWNFEILVLPMSHFCGYLSTPGYKLRSQNKGLRIEKKPELVALNIFY